MDKDSGNLVGHLSAPDLNSLHMMLRRLPRKVRIIQYMRDGANWYVFFEKDNLIHEPLLSTENVVQEEAKKTRTRRL